MQTGKAVTAAPAPCYWPTATGSWEIDASVAPWMWAPAAPQQNKADLTVMQVV
jgi:hypothetical protein